jgi:hypothetical protein
MQAAKAVKKPLQTGNLHHWQKMLIFFSTILVLINKKKNNEVLWMVPHDKARTICQSVSPT